MKVLVTGGAGFIGSHLAQQLVSKGEEVRILDNFSTGSYANIHGLPVEVIRGDIRNARDVEAAVRGVDIVFHQAALCSLRWSSEELLAVNGTGTQLLLDACLEAGVRRVVAASTSLVYDSTRNKPQDEYGETNPFSPYGVSKLMTETLCQSYWNAFNLETVILRYFNVFGPRQDLSSEYSLSFPRLLMEMLNGAKPQIIGNGAQTQDLTYVDNVVQANLLAAASPTAAGKIINIAEGKSLSERDLLEVLKEITNRDCVPRFLEKLPGKVQHSRASIERARILLGYAPSVEFKEGMKRTVDWYIASRSERKEPLARPATPRLAAVKTTPVPKAAAPEFPLVRNFRLPRERRMPLQIRNWVDGVSETKAKILAKVAG